MAWNVEAARPAGGTVSRDRLRARTWRSRRPPRRGSTFHANPHLAKAAYVPRAGAGEDQVHALDALLPAVERGHAYRLED